MELQPNRFKRAIAQGERQIGLWSTLCSPIAAEALAYSGFDWLLLDTEHSPNEVPMIMNQLQAMAASATIPIVRPAWNDPVLFKRLLDIGTWNFLVPFVQNAEEASQAVASTRYPPAGIRGVSVSQRANRYGRITDYFQKANDEICVLVQVETSTAVGMVDQIAGVDGVDGVFVGPSDLAAGIGHLGNPKHPEVQAAIGKALEACKKAGKPAGILAFNEDDARGYLDAGFVFVAVGSDLGLLTRNADALARKFKRGDVP
jgi:4-hydroxy-2-oxoheptanedioate aldolase